MRVAAALVFACACGKTAEAPPLTLDDVLAIEYRGRTLAAILAADPGQRYYADVIIAFRSKLGEEGGVWLGRAIRDGRGPDRERAHWLLISDLDAAGECTSMLEDELDDTSNPVTSVTTAAVLIQIGGRSDRAVATLVGSLEGEDWQPAFQAAQQIAGMGEAVEEIAPEVIAYLEACRRNHGPTEVKSFEDLVETEATMREQCHCYTLLHALGWGGKAADAFVPSAVRLLQNPRSEKCGLLDFLASRNAAARGAEGVIVPYCASEDSDVRTAAGRALKAIGADSDAARAALEKLANADD